MRLSKRILIFIIGFAVIFAAIQYVFLFRWAASEDSRTTDLQFEEMPDGAVDVLFFGTSETHQAIAPSIIFERSGITSYNMATSWGSATVVYHRLVYALKHQHPKVAVCDFRGLFDPVLYESDYIRAYKNFTDRKVRKDMLDDACRDDKSLDRMEFYLPIHRYHSLWHDMTPANLLPRGYMNRDKLPPFLLGGYQAGKGYHGEPPLITPELWDDAGYSDPIAPVNAGYYTKFIDLCHENDITVVFIGYPFIYPPAYNTGIQDTRFNWLTSQGVFYYDLNNYDSVTELGIIPEEDYLDESHCSFSGAVKVSEAAADILSDPYYGLADHRNEPGYEVWEGLADRFRVFYSDEENHN